MEVRIFREPSTGKLPAEWQRARTLYYRGMAGDENAFRAADHLFSELYASHPALPLIQVYYGSLRLLEAGRTWAVWQKQRLSEQGILLVDSAVRADPQNLEIRFVRAVTTYHLPAFFHRKQQSKDDFAHLARVAERAVRNGQFEPRLAAASLYFYGEFLAEDGCKREAIASWRSAVTLAPGSPAAEGAEKRLRKLGLLSRCTQKLE